MLFFYTSLVESKSDNQMIERSQSEVTKAFLFSIANNKRQQNWAQLLTTSENKHKTCLKNLIFHQILRTNHNCCTSSLMAFAGTCGSIPLALAAPHTPTEAYTNIAHYTAL